MCIIFRISLLWWQREFAMLSQQDLTVLHRASRGVTRCSAFSVFSCPVNVQWGRGLVSVEESPRQSGLLGLQALLAELGGVWDPDPAAVWIPLHKDSNQRVQQVSEERSATSPLGQGGVKSRVNQTLRDLIIPTTMFHRQSDTLQYCSFTLLSLLSISNLD